MSREVPGQTYNKHKLLNEDNNMTNANIINVHKLTNEGFYGFHKNVVEQASKINVEEFRALLDNYTTAVEKFGGYITSIAEAEAKKIASINGTKRMEAFNGFRNYVKSITKHPNADMEKLANNVWKFMKDYVRVTHADRDKLTAMIDLTIANVSELVASETFAAAYAGSDFEQWFNLLDSAEKEYLAAVKSCVEERRIREQETNNRIRNECTEAFYLLLNFAKYMAATKNDSDCGEFIREVELMADTRRSLYKSRDKQRAKKKATSENTKNAEHANSKQAANTSTETSTTATLTAVGQSDAA